MGPWMYRPAADAFGWNMGRKVTTCPAIQVSALLRRGIVAQPFPALHDLQGELSAPLCCVAVSDRIAASVLHLQTEQHPISDVMFLSLPLHSSQILRFALYYMRDGRLIRTKKVSIRCFFPEELQALCRLNGLNGLDVVERFGNYDGSPFTSSSPKQVLFCRAS